MNQYEVNQEIIDSVDLKCLVVSKGCKVGRDVYKQYSKNTRLSTNPLMCNCFFLSDGTLVQLTDMSFHLKYLTGILSWDNLKLLKVASELTTPFTLKMQDGEAALFYEEQFIDDVTFPVENHFYYKKTSSGLPFIGNAVLQGTDWVAFPCLWPCEHAASGSACQFCFSGADYEQLTKKGKPLPGPVPAADVAEIVDFAINSCNCNSIQLTGGSTFDEHKEAELIKGYLTAINEKVGRENIKGDILLYITPPEDLSILDDYMTLGADRIACSLEVWDQDLAKAVTPGKINITTRERHLRALEYVTEKHGKGKAFSNFIIGVEPMDSLIEGATYLAKRGIIPTASVWMPMGRPVQGNMKPPGAAYYQEVKQRFAELYKEYNLEPSKCCGLNVCIERDIWNYSMK
jgi:hypothetical protein